MTLARIQPRQNPLARLVHPEELFTQANVCVKTHNSNHIEMDWTINRANAQALGINCYRIYVHIYGTSGGHDYVTDTNRDSVIVSPGEQSKPDTMKLVISHNTVNYMHSPVKEERN